MNRRHEVGIEQGKNSTPQTHLALGDDQSKMIRAGLSAVWH